MGNHLSFLPLSLLSFFPPLPTPSPSCSYTPHARSSQSVVSIQAGLENLGSSLSKLGCGGGFSPYPRNEEKREGFKCERTKYDEPVKVEEEDCV